jgi:hypothetical protein
MTGTSTASITCGANSTNIVQATCLPTRTAGRRHDCDHPAGKGTSDPSNSHSDGTCAYVRGVPHRWRSCPWACRLRRFFGVPSACTWTVPARDVYSPPDLCSCRGCSPCKDQRQLETAVASCEVLPDGPILSSTTGCSIPGVPSYIRARGGTSGGAGPPSGVVSLECDSQNV